MRARDNELKKYIELLERYLEGAQRARSDSARHAADERHKLPLPTVKALKKEYDKQREALILEKGIEPKPTTVFKKVSDQLFKNEKHWRRIRTHVEKPTT
jgi:hypothetical protein